ncbi:hypothetical protein Tco_1035096, partial [Tanacetum coccineum]
IVATSRDTIGETHGTCNILPFMTGCCNELNAVNRRLVCIEGGHRCIYTYFLNNNWIKLQLEDCDQLFSNNIPQSVSVYLQFEL